MAPEFAICAYYGYTVMYLFIISHSHMASLQQQFPLSPRKFWKKIRAKMLTTIIWVWIVVAFAIALGVGGSIIVLPIAVLLLYFVAYAVYIKTYIKRYYYAGEDYFITIKKGVFTTAEIHVQWGKIQDVYVDQDIVDRILWLYDVHIASTTSASALEAHIDWVDKNTAEGLKKYLLDKISGKSTDIINEENKKWVSAAKSVALNVTDEISNKTYPLSIKWFLLICFSRVVWVAVAALFLVGFLDSKVRSALDFNQSHIYLYTFIVLATYQVWVLFLWKKNYAFKFNSDNIYYKEGIVSMSEKHMPYWSIQDIAVNQSFLERIFWLAQVQIENAANNSSNTKDSFSWITLKGISLKDAKKLTDVLKPILNQNSTRYGV